MSVPPLPLQRPRRKVQRFTLSHDQRRLTQHYDVDPQRLEFARLSIGAACGPFAGIFGNPYAVLHSMFYPTGRIIKFLAKAGMK